MYTEVNGQKAFFSNGNGTIRPDQPNVAFVHGAGMDHSVWTLPARYFARHGYNVYALDLPGHGRSAGQPLASVGGMSDWLQAALAALGVGVTAVVGHSMGSLVALDFAARYAGNVRALALLGTSTPMPVTGALLDAARENRHDAIDMANAWSHSNFGQRGGNENPGICMTMSGQRLLERSGPGVFFADLNACDEFAGGESLASRVKADTLVIVGNQDRMTAPVNALKVAALIPGAKVVRLEPCGHAMLSEQPNAVLDALATIV